MRVYDVTLPIKADMPVYPGDAGVSVTPVAEMAKGSPYNLSLISLGSHSGTHVDPPGHFIPGGATVDQLPLDVLIGPAWVVELPQADAVTAHHLEALHLSPSVQRLLFKTRNGQLWERREFTPDFVAVREDGARWLVERGVRLVGIDYLSIEAYGAPEPVTHRTLLGAGVVVIEGLDLRAVPPGEYTLVCLPLPIVGGDGAPARVVLLQE